MTIAASYQSTYTRPSREKSGGRTAPVTISGNGFGPNRGREHDIKALRSGQPMGFTGVGGLNTLILPLPPKPPCRAKRKFFRQAVVTRLTGVYLGIP